MIIIKNSLQLSPETLYHKMDIEFAAYINEKLGSNLAITFQHVFDLINVYFPEILPAIPLYRRSTWNNFITIAVN